MRVSNTTPHTTVPGCVWANVHAQFGASCDSLASVEEGGIIYIYLLQFNQAPQFRPSALARNFARTFANGQPPPVVWGVVRNPAECQGGGDWPLQNWAAAGGQKKRGRTGPLASLLHWE